MESLESIKKKLDSLTSALLLFLDDTLVLMNAYGEQLFPEITPGITVDALLGEAAEVFRRFSGNGAMLLPLELSGLMLDAKITAYDGYTAIELIEAPETLSASALRSIAEGLLLPMTTVMALTPKLLPQLEQGDDPANMSRAAQLNRGIYNLYRVANHLRLLGLASDPAQYRKKQIHIMPWLQDFTQRLRPMIDAAHRQLQVHIPSMTHLCELDVEQMERAILILVSNAIKFTNENGLIQITATETRGNRLRITVHDNGCGIPSGEMGVIFHRKEHRPQRPDSRYGAGLSLPIARCIVQAHDGKLLLESQENVGTAVHLSLTASHHAPLVLHSTVQTPSFSSGFDPMLVELSDSLPSSVFDTRGIDL